jgi:hypothetical protein
MAIRPFANAASTFQTVFYSAKTLCLFCKKAHSKQK